MASLNKLKLWTAIFLSFLIWRTIAQITDPDSENQCPGIKGCRCAGKDSSLDLRCQDITDPELYLIPHENITTIRFQRIIFTNVSALDEVKRTRIHKLSMFENVIGNSSDRFFNWDWLPDTTKNLTLWKNGFSNFAISGTVVNNCTITRFLSEMTIYISQEKFPIFPQCLPNIMRWLILNNMPDIEFQESFKWPQNLTALKLSEGGFGNMPENMFENAPPSLRAIWISFQELKGGEWPEGLPAVSLKRLLITNSEMLKIPREEMQRYRDANLLVELILGYNNLTEIPDNLPRSLIKLNMHHNKLEHVEPKVWSGLPNLQYLDLSNNNLVTVPLGMPATLTTVYLRHNLLDYSSPEAFKSMTNLRTLDLAYNRLTSLPRGIQPNIKSYLIQHNQISLVRGPSEYNFCSKCTSMWLHGNPWFCDVEMMKMLSWLATRNIPTETYSSLQQDRAQCLKIPLKGVDTGSLQKVFESLIYFKQPPYNVCTYEIQTLKCEETDLLQIPEVIPVDLIEIRISHNPNITFIPDFKFQTQNELIRLYLNNNSLTHIPYGLPPSLQHLNLRNNKIADFTDRDVQALQNLTSLRSLELDDNRIKTLYAWQFTALTNLEWIGMAGNLLECDCSLLSFTFWYQQLIKYSNIIADYAACYTPSYRRYDDIRTMVGYYIYELQCAPLNCEWDDTSGFLNCSAQAQSIERFTSNGIPQLGEPPKIPVSTYWTKLDLSDLELQNKDIEYRHLTHLREVDLSGNMLKTIPFEGLPNSVEVLKLSGNDIQHIPSHKTLVKHLPKLQELDLRNNLIEHMDKEEVALFGVLESLLLEGNQIKCDCKMRPLANWIHVNKNNEKMTTSHQLKALECQQEDSLAKVKIMNLSDEAYCVTPSYIPIVLGCIGGLLLIALIIVLANILISRNQKTRVQRQILRGFQDLLAREAGTVETDPETGIDSGKEFKFDAFVSYDADSIDAEFVITLLEEMEDKRGYKLCLNERDFIPGVGITDNIVECIGASKRIILVLSRNFVSSPWGKYEVQAALVELHQRRRSKLLVTLMLEDIRMDTNLADSVKTLLSLMPEIMVPAHTADDSKVWKDFWDRLIQAMPLPRGQSMRV